MKTIIIRELISTINDILGEKSAIEKDLDKEIHLDSIQFMQLIVILEAEYEIRIPDQYLIMTELNTVRKIMRVLSEAKNT